MTARQRILALKLLKYQERHPEDARRIGFQVRVVKKDSKNREGVRRWN